ncbi:MAG: hypothetical protein R2736_21585 [Solirubrobacterales bacterium]
MRLRRRAHRAIGVPPRRALRESRTARSALPAGGRHRSTDGRAALLAEDTVDWKPSTSGAAPMTILWFVIWLIANNTGDREPLTFDPVNAWTATLILAVALDLAGAHAGRRGRAA